MSPADAAKLLGFLTPDEQLELDAIVREDQAERAWVPLPGPQTMAHESLADIVGYGGAAGGGKTDLIAGLASQEHYRTLIVRKEKAQTEGVIQRLTEILGSSDGYNSQKGTWRLAIPGQADERLIEFAGLDDPKDHTRWQGRPHDLKAFDEVTEQREAQVRFVMGWTRTNRVGVHARVLMTFNPPTTQEGRWVIDFFGPWLDDKHPNPAAPGELRWFTTIDGKDMEVTDRRRFVLEDGQPVYEFDESDYTPEQIIVPKSRTFIPARLVDNPYYMATGYMSQLQALPEPLRSQMLYGDFKAGIGEDPWQVIPTAWVDAAMARWKKREPRGEMLSMGVDVARGGKDKTTIVTRHADGDHGLWFDKASAFPGTETPDGPMVAGLVVSKLKDQAPIHIDVIGVGASPYDTLNGMGLAVLGVNVSEKATARDKSGRMFFKNQRSQFWWKMREALDPAEDNGIALPPDPALKAELCAPRWRAQGFEIYVESREDIVARIQRSPDLATAYILALIETPKVRDIKSLAAAAQSVNNYDPMAAMR